MAKIKTIFEHMATLEHEMQKRFNVLIENTNIEQGDKVKFVYEVSKLTEQAMESLVDSAPEYPDNPDEGLEDMLDYGSKCGVCNFYDHIEEWKKQMKGDK